MSAKEGAPTSPAVPDPAAANLATQDKTPEEIVAARAEDKMETVYDLVMSGKTGVRHALREGTYVTVKTTHGRDSVPVTALYTDGIGYTTEGGGDYSPIRSVLANRPTTAIPKHVGGRQPQERTDATLDFDGQSVAFTASREERASRIHCARLITRDKAGQPLYEDVAFRNPPGDYLVRRNNLSDVDNPDYGQGLHSDPLRYAKITYEVTDIILAAAKACATQPLAEARSVVEACEALETMPLARTHEPTGHPAS